MNLFNLFIDFALHSKSSATRLKNNQRRDGGWSVIAAVPHSRDKCPVIASTEPLFSDDAVKWRLLIMRPSFPSPCPCVIWSHISFDSFHSGKIIQTKITDHQATIQLVGISDTPGRKMYLHSLKTVQSNFSKGKKNSSSCVTNTPKKGKEKTTTAVLS